MSLLSYEGPYAASVFQKESGGRALRRSIWQSSTRRIGQQRDVATTAVSAMATTTATATTPQRISIHLTPATLCANGSSRGGGGVVDAQSVH